MSLIGLDIGTTGCKCTIFGIDGKAGAYSYSEYDTKSPRSGYFEIDPDEVWESVKKVIFNAVSSYRGENIKALSISSFGEAVVLVDKNDKVLANSILYMDRRGADECKIIEEILGKEKIMQIAGVSSHPMYTINKIMWIKKNVPEIYNRACRFMLFGDFISYRLAGDAVIDHSLASRTMTFDIVSKKWSDKILEIADIDEKKFSKIAPSGTIIGRVRREIAKEIGLSDDILVVTGGHDQVCAAVGAGVLNEGMAIDGIGTVECITPVFNRPVINKVMLKNKYNCVPFAKKGMYASYAFNFTGGSLLKWYRDTFASYLKEYADKTGMNTYEFLDKAASKNPTRLLVIPHFAGAGTPYMDTDAKGAILGLDLNTSAPEIYRAMLEGVTYEMALNVECLQIAGIEISTLRAVGGGARSDLWLQIKADIMQRKVERLNIDEAGTLGAAIIAGTATGVFGTFQEAASLLIKVKKEFFPDLRQGDIYSENFKKYKKAYKSLKNIFA